MKRFLATWLGMVAVLVLTLGTGQAQGQIIFTLDTGNVTTPPEAPGAGSVPGPYGTVVVTDTGTNTVSLVVTALPTTARGTTNPPQFNDLQWNTSTLATAPSTQSVGGFTWTLGAGNTQGFGFLGAFDQGLSTPNASQRLTTGTFTLTGTGLNEHSFTAFKFHWFSNFDPGQQVTGFATSIPEPGPLLGAGVVTLMGLGYTWRRRKRATA